LTDQEADMNYWNRRHSIVTLILSALLFVSDPVAAQEAGTRNVLVGGRQIAYHVIGDGIRPPLVLINGGPGFDHGYFHLTGVWDQLAVDRKVVFFDQPGTGGSYPVGPSDTLTVRDLLVAIRAIQNELGAPRVALLGHSWGGYVAMAFATACPGRTDRLILIGSASPKFTETEFNFSPLFPDSLARGSSPAGTPNGALIDLRRHLAMSFYDPDIRDRVLAGFRGLPFNGRQARLLRIDASSNDLEPQLAQLALPTLVGTGRFDGNVAPRSSWRVHTAIPGSVFVVWERSGHYPMIEEPRAFADVINRFLQTPRPSASEACQLP
jgi:proline iminopeptidase